MIYSNFKIAGISVLALVAFGGCEQIYSIRTSDSIALKDVEVGGTIDPAAPPAPGSVADNDDNPDSGSTPIPQNSSLPSSPPPAFGGGQIILNISSVEVFIQDFRGQTSNKSTTRTDVGRVNILVLERGFLGNVQMSEGDSFKAVTFKLFASGHEVRDASGAKVCDLTVSSNKFMMNVEDKTVSAGCTYSIQIAESNVLLKETKSGCSLNPSAKDVVVIENCSR